MFDESLCIHIIHINCTYLYRRVTIRNAMVACRALFELSRPHSSTQLWRLQ